MSSFYFFRSAAKRLDFCGKHNSVSDIELMKSNQINEAYKGLLASDVKYRFVVDIARPA